jgi:hypothetical protein
VPYSLQARPPGDDGQKKRKRPTMLDPSHARLVRKVELGYDYNTNGTNSTDPRILVA